MMRVNMRMKMQTDDHIIIYAIRASAKEPLLPSTNLESACKSTWGASASIPGVYSRSL